MTIKQVRCWEDLTKGDVIIWHKYDVEQEDDSNYNQLRGHRLTVLDILDSCDNEECYHTLKVETTNGTKMTIDIDDGHNGLFSEMIIFRNYKL
jgi:hypothetical protein